MAVRGCIACVIRVLIRELIGVNITRNQADSKQMKKEATPSRTQSVTPRKLLQNTIVNDPEPKEKQKPIKSRKKGRRMWPKMWPRWRSFWGSKEGAWGVCGRGCARKSRGFWGRRNVNRCNGTFMVILGHILGHGLWASLGSGHGISGTIHSLGESGNDMSVALSTCS